VFYDWMQDTHPGEMECAADLCNPALKSYNVDVVVTAIKILCCIESRSELESDRDVAKRFNELIRLPYMAFTREGGVDE
jgi:hypothetical protein